MRCTTFWAELWRPTPALDRGTDAGTTMPVPAGDAFLDGVPLSAVLANPEHCHALAATLTPVALTLPGAGLVTAVLGRPGSQPAPLAIVIHEWWGLTDQIKAMAAHLAELGYLTLAVDLMYGQVAATADQAVALSAKVSGVTARETLVGWIRWGREQGLCDGRVAVLGWCFGGSLALSASLATPVEATVIYSGLVMRRGASLAALKGPVLGHFGLRDEFIPANAVARFAADMATAGRDFRHHLYDAGHGFANPTGNPPRAGRLTHHDHDRREATTLAWRRTRAFLAETLPCPARPDTPGAVVRKS